MANQKELNYDTLTRLVKNNIANRVDGLTACKQ